LKVRDMLLVYALTHAYVWIMRYVGRRGCKWRRIGRTAVAEDPLSFLPPTNACQSNQTQTRSIYVQGAACPLDDMVTGDGLLKASLPTDRRAIKPPMAATERIMMMRVKLLPCCFGREMGRSVRG